MLNVTILPPVPTAPPTSVRATSTSTSITVRWGAVACIDQNGDITGYSVRYGAVESDISQTLSVSELEATITSLMSSTNYTVEVAAVNSAGTGVYSSPIFIDTQESESLDRHSTI